MYYFKDGKNTDMTTIISAGVHISEFNLNIFTINTGA